MGTLSFYCDKITIWRILNHGFFHQKIALIWKVHNGLCPCCSTHLETIDHLFFGCRNLFRRWATIAVILAGTSFAPVFCKDSPWGIIYIGVLRARRSPIPFTIIVDMIQSIWRECNKIRYRGAQSQIPIRRLLGQSVIHGRAILETCSSVRKRRRWDEDLQVLERAANLPDHLHLDDHAPT